MRRNIICLFYLYELRIQCICSDYKNFTELFKLFNMMEVMEKIKYVYKDYI